MHRDETSSTGPKHAGLEDRPEQRGGKAGAIAMLPVVPRVRRSTSHKDRWGVILAGGDGVRLRPLTRLICGDERPKQFCALFRGQTLLEQTLHRAERSIAPDQLLVSLSGRHRDWYSRQDGLRRSQRIVQPANRGTAPPILHGLLSLARLDAQALVAILPCDHHYSDEQAFASALDCAFEAAAERTDSVVLLGAKPDYPEVEYGWIELGASVGDRDRELFQVRKFQEKPVIEVARRLLERGSVWNTFVMVGHVQAFLQMLEETLPDLLSMFRSTRMWAGEETILEDSLYARVPSVCFSHHVLSETGKLMVLRLNDVGWSDLGDPGRVLMAARDSGCEPSWIQKWGHAKGMAIAASEAAAGAA